MLAYGHKSEHRVQVIWSENLQSQSDYRLFILCYRDNSHLFVPKMNAHFLYKLKDLF